MSTKSRVHRRQGRFSILFLFSVMTFLFGVINAVAQGGFALSGSFYTQAFELPQGASLSAPDVYVVVFNHTGDGFQVRMLAETPVGITLIPSENDFALSAGEQKKVELALEVAPNADPGTYEIGITAEPYREDTTGIQVIGAASQTATLVVTGEGARVTVQTEDPGGVPVPGVVRLFKVVADQRYEVAYSETGGLETIVAPGNYMTTAYLAGERLAEESFAVAANEDKRISLVVRTVYFENFGLVPGYSKETGELAVAQILYSVKNLLRPIESAEIFLQVSREGTEIDTVSLALLSPLDVGRVGLSYNYVPVDGWQNGSYDFKLQVHLDAKPFTSTEEKTLLVENRSVASTLAPGDWALYAGGGILGVLFLGYFLAITRRRRNTDEQ